MIPKLKLIVKVKVKIDSRISWMESISVINNIEVTAYERQTYSRNTLYNNRNNSW